MKAVFEIMVNYVTITASLSIDLTINALISFRRD